MKFIVAVFLMCFALASAEFKKTEEEFLKASENCFKKLKIAESYAPKFANFEYPDEPIVHDFLHCVFTDMELYEDNVGFKVDLIAELYKDKANPEVLVPVLAECNKKLDNESDKKRLFRAFKCILESRVGTWFKEDIAKHTSKN